MTTAIPEGSPVAGLGHTSITPQLLASVGYGDETSAASTSIMVDHHFERMVTHDGQVEVMQLQDAVITYPWLQDLMFSLIDPTSNAVLRHAFENTLRPLGTFTWVHDGAVIDKPLQSFSVMTVPHERQFVHDITIIGEGAVVDSLSGAAVTEKLTHGTHVSASETFIGKNARVRSLAVERWGKQMQVHSYAATKLEEGAVNSAVNVAVSGVRSNTSQTKTIVGDNAIDSTHDIVFASAGTHREMNTEVTLQGENSRSEQVARMVSEGGEIINNSTLIGEGVGCSGFLECDGLMVSPQGFIDSVPALKARTDQAKLSHEASVGMIDEEKLNYLMATGLDEDSARNLIVQGFLNLEEQALPAALKETVEGLIAAARAAEM